MKKIFLIVIFLVSFLFVPKVFAIEEIKNYDVSLYLQNNGDLKVEEKINYDFGVVPKHGIYRDIPLESKKKLEISNISVIDEKGYPYIFEETQDSENLHIKIGDPNLTIDGVHQYIISYLVEKPVTFFPDFDRVSWNAIGTGWDISVLEPTVKITIPSEWKSSLLEQNCYIGKYGSTESCDSHAIRALYSHEGVTIDLDFKKGIFVPPTPQELFLSWLKDWWPIVIPFLVLVFLLQHWYRKGRDPKGRGTIITQFDAPDNLTPAEVGTLIDEKADSKDIFAEIIYLATKGYIKIRKEEKTGLFGKEDYTLILLKPTSQIENKVDQKLLQALFKNFSAADNQEISVEKNLGTVKLSSLKNKFYKDLQEIAKILYEEMTRKEYFAKNPQKVKKRYAVIGICIGVFVIFLLQIQNHGISTMMVILSASLGISGLLFIVFGAQMPSKTQKGVDAKEHILGLKSYLTVAEKDRINFHNVPEKNPETFEKFLPYAMALGVTSIWAKQFQDLTVSPTWYESSSGHAFNAVLFSSQINNFSSFAKNNLASNPSSQGGGGFSGGGGGGGGGGSW